MLLFFASRECRRIVKYYGIVKVFCVDIYCIQYSVNIKWNEQII